AGRRRRGARSGSRGRVRCCRRGRRGGGGGRGRVGAAGRRGGHRQRRLARPDRDLERPVLGRDRREPVPAGAVTARGRGITREGKGLPWLTPSSTWSGRTSCR